MGDQNAGKLNRLLAELGDTCLVSSRWLRAHDYFNNGLVARYVGNCSGTNAAVLPCNWASA